MKTGIKRFFFHNRYIFTAFWLPVVLVAIALAATGIYPFGTQQIPVIDMYHQYVPFLSELQYKLQHGGSLFYTWDGAAGSNFWNLMAYYGASPLNLILALFPATGLMEGVTVILLIKIGLAGAFMAIYLRDRTNTCDLGTAAFGALYALCAFVMGYYWCIMWMDAVLLLPLVIMGLNRIISGGSPALYVVTLALTVFCNYYISIMVCIFIFFYYPVTYFVQTGKRGAAACLKTTGKAAGYSVMAIAMAAVMLLPTYLSMQSTYYISSDMPENWTFYNDVLDLFNQLLPNAQLTFREGLPNIYCGLIVVLLMICYVTDWAVRLREKALNLGFLAFLFLSLNINKLDFIWHGFHFPNQLPYRYSFVVSFLLVGLAYREFIRLERIRTGVIWAGMAGILGWYVICQRFLKDSIDNVDVYFYMGVALLLSYTAVIMLHKKGYLSRRNMVRVASFVIACELGFTVTIGFQKVGNTDREYYFENYGDVRSLIEEVDDDFSRLEIDDNFILNTPAFYHYKGVSQFSSSINSNATYTMENIGVEGEPGKNRYNYNLTSPVTNAILNVKYLIGKSEEIDDYDLHEIDRSGDSVLYENQYSLAMGYVTGNAIWSWDINLDNPFGVLDDYVRAATDNMVEGVFVMAEPSDIDTTNMTIDENGESAWVSESTDDTSDGYIDITYEAEETQKYYVFVEADSCRDITVYKENSEDGIFIREDCGSVVNIGTVNEGETFRVEMAYDPGNMGSLVCHAASIDQEAWDDAYSIISKDMMEVDAWSDTYVKGTVDASRDGVLVTSIPYEDGWTVKVDGKKRESIQQAGEIFIAADISSGVHQLEFSFRPPGFVPGLMLTILACIALAFITIILPGLRSSPARRRQEPAELSVSLPEGFDYSIEDTHSLPEEEQAGCPE